MFCVACGTYQGWDLGAPRGDAVRDAEPVASVQPVPLPAAAVEYAEHQPGHGTFVIPVCMPGEFPENGTAPPLYEVPRLVLCPACRGDNPETRTFCSPCGELLRPEPEPPVLTRWQRLHRQYLERPRTWHGDRRWFLVAAALPFCLAGCMSAGAAVGAAQQGVPRVKDHFAGQSVVTPESVEASSSSKGFDAEYATDGVDNRAWAPWGSGTDAVGQNWTATFQQPFRLTTLVIINGGSTSPRQFLETGRPTRITVTVVTADKERIRKELTLADQPGPQRFRMGIDAVVAVDLQIEAVHSGLKSDMPVAVAEVRFFARKTS